MLQTRLLYHNKRSQRHEPCASVSDSECRAGHRSSCTSGSSLSRLGHRSDPHRHQELEHFSAQTLNCCLRLSFIVNNMQLTCLYNKTMMTSMIVMRMMTTNQQHNMIKNLKSTISAPTDAL